MGKVTDEAFQNVNEAQGVGLILNAGTLQHAKMRLAQGPLGAGRVCLLGILLAEGLSKDRTEPRAPKDTSCPSTTLLGYDHPGRCQTRQKKICNFGPNQHFIHRASLLMLHPSKGKESAREAGKPSSKALGKSIFFLSAFIWVGVGFVFLSLKSSWKNPFCC